MKATSKNLVYSKVSAKEEIPEIVDVHMRIFKDNVSGALGRKFLALYFQQILTSPVGVIFVAKDEGGVVGIMAGLASKKGFYSPGLIFWGMLSTLRELLVHPGIFILILRHFKRMFFVKGEACAAELMTTGLLEEYRGGGAGTTFIRMLEDFFRSISVNAYEAFTDLEHGKAFAFYEKCGFTIGAEVALFHKHARVYIKKLNSEKP